MKAQKLAEKIENEWYATAISEYRPPPPEAKEPSHSGQELLRLLHQMDLETIRASRR